MDSADVEQVERDGDVAMRGAFASGAWPAAYVDDGLAIDGSDPSPVAKAIVAGLTNGSR